jgi:sigma-E factor negative regulatory protein RseB
MVRLIQTGMKGPITSCLTFIALLISLNAQAGSDQTAKQWLERMIQAIHNLEYQGTFIHLHDNQLETMQIVHALKEGKLQERLISLNGAPREVIRDHTSVTCVMPESEQVSVDKRPLSGKFLALLPEELDQLDAYYMFKLLGQGRVAGRTAKVVAIIPKDGYRYGYRFFVDEDSALPLKSDLMNERGKAVEQTMFTHLEVGVADTKELQDDLLEAHQPFKVKTASERSKNAAKPMESSWEFHKLPKGFNVNTRNLLPDPDGNKMVEQYVLSDGLASLSVFIEAPDQDDESLNGVSRLGAINAWGGKMEGYQVTAVGEVPAVTLLDVVDSMRLKH